jgi:hypothetical protein
MLKLIRINDTPTGVPDIVDCSIKPGVYISSGEPYALSVDGLTDEISREKPIFIACETRQSIEEGEHASAKCFQVMPGMEFETVCYPENVLQVTKGSLVDLCYHEGTAVVKKAVDGGKFIVSDAMRVYSDEILRVKAI